MKRFDAFDIFNAVFMTALCLLTLYPFVHLLSLSLSPGDLSLTSLHLLPPDITWVNYQKVLTNEYILSGFLNTITRTVLGTALSVCVTVFAAYPLAKRFFPHRTFWTGYIVFTMFFSGGLIPNYLLVKNLGLMNSIWALVLPGLVSAFTLVITRNFMMALPEALEESAKMDGANEIVILFRIIIPLSLPIIATLSLWVAVGHWNAWFDSLIYTSDAHKQVLQVVMRRIVLLGSKDMMDVNKFDDPNLVANPDTIKAATIMVTILPILLMYPFLQKYFVKGVLVGSMKG